MAGKGRYGPFAHWALGDHPSLELSARPFVNY
jgi:hypothetical protein